MAENKVKRSDLMAFLNTGTTDEPVWSRMGKGITSQVVSYNPATTSETYIDEDSATTNLDSYAVNISTPQTAYAGNAVFDYVDNLRQNRAVGADAQAEVLLVYAYAKDGENKFKAERNNAVLQIDDFGGEGGGSVVLNYTVNLNGNPVLGTATIEGGTVTFTAE
jgi:hypothetical protein